MKHLVFIFVVAVVTSLVAGRRVSVGNPPIYGHRVVDSAAQNIPTENKRFTRSQNVATSNLPYRSNYNNDFSLHNIADSLRAIKDAQSYEKFDHHESFLGPSVADIFGDAELTRAEVVVLMGSGLASLMEASLDKTYGTGMQEFRDVTLAMTDASRKVLENRLANGIPVSEEQFENIQKVKESMTAVLDVIAATFDENEDAVYSLSRFFEDFEFDPVERAKYIARVVPTISRAVFQDDDTTTEEKLREAFEIFLPATRKFLEERIEEGKPVTQQQLDMLERAEKLVPDLVQAFVTVMHDPVLLNFLNKLDLDITERAKFVVSGLFASMKAMFRDINASVAEMIRDSTLAFLQPSRQVFEDRLAQGKPVTQEQFENLERMEKTLPIILDAYVKVVDDLRIP